MAALANVIAADEHRGDARMTPTTATRLRVLFGLSQALALPPEALMVLDPVVRPLVHAEPHAILSPIEVAATLDGSATEMGRGRVAAGALDWRLDGLVVSVDMFQLSQGGGASLTLGVVGPDAAMAGRRGATAADLWRLATAALARLGVASEHRLDFGDDAFLAVYGGRTVQVAWLAGERVATVTVTCLIGDRAWMIEAAQAIAVLVSDRLGRDASAPSRVPE